MRIVMKKNYAKFPGLRVLVIEDYFINQEVTKDMLELMECDVDVAENGQEGLDAYNEGNYDLLLVDIQMPIINGYEVTKTIREKECSQKHTKIIALTANALEGDMQKCLEAGADDYLSKPIDLEMLEEMLKKHFLTAAN